MYCIILKRPSFFPSPKQSTYHIPQIQDTEEIFEGEGRSKKTAQTPNQIFKEQPKDSDSTHQLLSSER